MRHQQFAAKIAYASIFAQTVEEAAENLARLIAKRECGFDEGAKAWLAVLEDYVNAPDDLGQLNRFGSTFTVPQWCVILRQVRSVLLTSSEPSPDGGPPPPATK